MSEPKIDGVGIFLIVFFASLVAVILGLFMYLRYLRKKTESNIEAGFRNLFS